MPAYVPMEDPQEGDTVMFVEGHLAWTITEITDRDVRGTRATISTMDQTQSRSVFISNASTKLLPVFVIRAQEQ